MVNKDELKEIDVKNCTCYYFDHVMKVIDIYPSNNLLDEKPYKKYENSFLWDISCKSFMGSIPLRIRLNEINGFIKIFYGTKYLVLFGHSWCAEIYDRIKLLISKKNWNYRWC